VILWIARSYAGKNYDVYIFQNAVCAVEVGNEWNRYNIVGSLISYARPAHM
jgi:hypothetical protein